MNHFIEKTLQLKDLNITINTEKIDEVKIKGRLSLVYYGQLTYVPKACECCGINNDNYQVVKNGFREASRITLNTISSLPAYLKLQKQRYYCKACGQSFTAKSPMIAEHCFISNAVKRKIMDLATRVQTEKNDCGRYECVHPHCPASDSSSGINSTDQTDPSTSHSLIFR